MYRVNRKRCTDRKPDAILEHWIELTRSSQRISRPSVEQAIRGIYRAIGQDMPELVFCGSPVSMALTCGFVSAFVGNWDGIEATLEPEHWESPLGSSLRGSIKQTITVLKRKNEPMGVSVKELVEKAFNNDMCKALLKSGGAALEGTIGANGSGPWVALADSVGWDEEQLVLKDNIRYCVQDAIHNLSRSCSCKGHEPAHLAMQTTMAAATNLWGVHYTWPALSLMDVVRGNPGSSKLIDAVRVLSINGCWILPYRSVCFVAERPVQIKTNVSGQLHSEVGPALEFRDGWHLNIWNGSMVRESATLPYVVLTPEEIALENHAYTQHVLIERYGRKRFLNDIRAKRIHVDSFGALYSYQPSEGELMKFVEVLNSTKFADGSREVFVLRVPPEVNSAREAVAWTFGMSEKAYNPKYQS